MIVTSLGGGCSEGDRGSNPVPDTAELAVRDGALAVRAVDFASVLVGQRDEIRLVIENVGRRTSGPLSASLDGDAAFAGSDISGCQAVVLGAGESCSVSLSFAPSQAVPARGELHITAQPGGEVNLGMMGSGVAGQAFDIVPPFADLGLVEMGATGTIELQVTNPGPLDASTIALQLADAAFAVAATTCTGALPVGASCAVTVRVSPTAPGALDTSLLAVTDVGAGTASLTATGAGRITVTLAGPGNGSVTSIPSGIACGTTCTGLFAEPVSLIASADGGSGFAGWDGECGAATSCEVAVGPRPAELRATFQPLAGLRSITASLAGSAPGAIAWDAVGDSSGDCDASCNIVVPLGTPVQIMAVTPGTFAGFSGACSGTGMCEVTADENRSLTATFALDEGQVGLVPLPLPTRSLAFHPSGDVILTNGAYLMRMTTRGTIVWTIRLALAGAPEPPAMRVAGLTTDAAGHVYALVEPSLPEVPGNLQLHKVAPDGAEIWNRTFTGARTFSDSDFARGEMIAVATSGQVAVLAAAGGSGALRLYEPDGDIAWTESGLPSPYAVAIGPGDIVHAIVEDASADGTQVLRFDLAQVALPGIDSVPGGINASTAIDSQSNVLSSTYRNGTVTVSRLTPNGSSIFVDQTELDGDVEQAVCLDAGENAIAIRDAFSGNFSPSAPGYVLRRLGPTGALLLEIDKPPTEFFRQIYPFQFGYGAEPVGLAADHLGQVAVAYRFDSPGDLLPRFWLSIYAR
jgi:hypothetical protein